MSYQWISRYLLPRKIGYDVFSKQGNEATEHWIESRHFNYKGLITVTVKIGGPTLQTLHNRLAQDRKRCGLKVPESYDLIRDSLHWGNELFQRSKAASTEQ